jgi:UPF0716 protein FxsA
MPLLWLFFLWPVIEIALFIKVGGLLGIIPTLVLVFAAGAVGVWLVRMQGMLVMNDLRLRLNALSDPSEPMAHGALIALAGFLFMIPGFFSDLLGLALLIPRVRRWLIGQVAARVVSSRPGADPFRSEARPTVIDGEFYEIEPTEARLPPRPHRPSGWTQH